MSDEIAPEHGRNPWGSILATDGFVLGIKIGVPRSRVALARLDGATIGEASRSGPPLESASDTLDAVYQMVADVCERNSIGTDAIVRIGIGFAGPVDSDNGVVLVSHRAPGWQNVPLKELFEDRYNIPTILDNDANVAALGEASFGSAGSVKDLLYIHLGEGVGGGLLLNGHIYHGASGTAGEIGHMMVDPEGPLCNCGGRGQLQSVLSRQAILRRAESLMDASVEESLMPGLAGGKAENIAVEHVFSAAGKGDAAAIRVVDEVLRYLSIGIGSLINILNPAVISIGGPTAEVGSPLFVPLEEMVRSEAMTAPGRTVRIVPAKLGSDATIKGAVALALYSLQY